MKNQTFILPQYIYLRHSLHHRDENFDCDLSDMDCPLWLMREVSTSGVACNGWILSYDRSWKVWKIYHPQVYLFATLAKTKDVAQKIANVVNPNEYDFYFSERGDICSESTWKELSNKITTNISDIIEEKQYFEDASMGMSTVWREE